MAKTESAPRDIEVETLRDGIDRLKDEKERTRIEIEKLNALKLSPETPKDRRNELKEEIEKLKKQRKTVNGNLVDFQEQLVRLQENGGSIEGKTKNEKAKKPQRGEEAVPVVAEEAVEVPPALSVAKPKAAPKNTPKNERPPEPNLEYAKDLAEVLEVLNRKKKSRTANRAAIVEKDQIAPTKEIKSILEKANGRELNPEEKKSIVSIIKNFPRDPESELLHNTVFDILIGEGKLSKEDFRSKKAENPDRHLQRALDASESLVQFYKALEDQTEFEKNIGVKTQDYEALRKEVALIEANLNNLTPQEIDQKINSLSTNYPGIKGTVRFLIGKLKPKQPQQPAKIEVPKPTQKRVVREQKLDDQWKDRPEEKITREEREEARKKLEQAFGVSIPEKTVGTELAELEHRLEIVRGKIEK